MSDKWYVAGPLGIGEPEPRSPLTVSGEISLKSPDNNIYSLQFVRKDEENRQHTWALWHMNKAYRKNALEIWEYKTDSTGKDCGGNTNDGAMCNPRLTILEGGNVGIGVAIPSARLQVANGAIMPAVGNTSSAGIQFPSDPGGGAGDSAFIRYFSESGETTKLLIGCTNDADDRISFYQFGGERMTLYNGNVGIGTNVPKAPLHISGLDSANIKLLSSDPVADFAYDGGTDAVFWFVHCGHPNGATHFRHHYEGQPDKDLLVIKNNGNVGIGTNNPVYRLEVNGDLKVAADIACNGTLSVGGNITGGSSDGRTVPLQTYFSDMEGNLFKHVIQFQWGPPFAIYVDGQRVITL